jgi:uncharacterized protein (TIGR02246 family)
MNKRPTKPVKPKVAHKALPVLAISTAFLSAIVPVRAEDTISAAEKADKEEGIAAPRIIETKNIAEEGFIYGLPIVMNYGVMYEYAVDKNSGQYKAPFNEIKNEPRVYTYKDTAIVTPNSDTPYSMAWLDLRAEPIVLSVPAVEKSRYYSVMLCDGNVFNYGYIGSRATGNDAGDYMVVGPDWKGETPPGIKKVFQSTTQFSLAVYRTQLFNPEDMPNVEKVQAGYKVQPLSAFLGKPPPPPAPTINFPKINKEMVKTNFFEYLDFLLQFAPAGPEEKEIRARLAKIGIGPGKTFDFKDLSLEHKAEIALGMKEGEEKIKKYLDAGQKNVNGWTMGSFFGDREFYHGNWLLRAAGATGGIYGNDAVEAAYPLTKTLANGEELDGSKHKYTLTFPAGQYPPVNAFWSVTMYDGKTQLLIKNPINRYLINSPMLPNLKKNADGSLTIYIQKDSPGADKESNWLPASDGPIYLAMRLYWPKTEAPSVLPIGEGTWKPPSIEKADVEKAKGGAESRAALARAAEAFVEAFNKGDAEAVAAFWTPDGDYIDQTGRLLKGREAIEEAYSQFFAKNKGLKLRIESESVRFPTPETAVEDGTSAVLPQDGAPPSRARYTSIFVRKDGNWLLSSVREAAYAPPSDAGHLRALEWAIGEWVDDVDGQEVGHVAFEWSPEGTFIVAPYAVTLKDVVMSRGMQWIGWDPTTDQIRSWSFESDGGFGESTWAEEDNKWVIKTNAILPDGKKLAATNIVTPIGENEITWQSKDRNLDGKALPDIEAIKLKRVPKQSQTEER